MVLKEHSYRKKSYCQFDGHVIDDVTSSQKVRGSVTSKFPGNHISEFLFLRQCYSTAWWSVGQWSVVWQLRSI